MHYNIVTILLFSLAIVRGTFAWRPLAWERAKPSKLSVRSQSRFVGDELLTVFSLLETTNVILVVIVVTCFGVGSFVFAIWTWLVGYCGLGFLAVILVPGCFCMGANFVAPVCAVYGVVASPAAAGLPSAAALIWFSVAGPPVPLMSLIPSTTLAGNVPVIPLSVNRSE